MDNMLPAGRVLTLGHDYGLLHLRRCSRYNLAVGAGAGLWWSDNGFSISTSYLSTDGELGDVEAGGIMTDG